MRTLVTALAAMVAITGWAAPSAPSPLVETLKSIAERGAPDGYLTMPFARVRDTNGTLRVMANLQVPYWIEPVRAVNMAPARRSGNFFSRVAPGSKGQRAGRGEDREGFRRTPESNLTVYRADAGEPYGYVEDNPSSLDDLVISSSGVNRAWTELTFGFNYAASPFTNFLVRWRCYSNRQSATAPANSFSSEFADFGVIWSQAVTPGTYKVTISVVAAAVVAPSTNVYMATQFRDPSNLQGNGAFIGYADVMFNPNGVPAVGSSEDQFWYDWDPRNGAYNDNEIDVFEGQRADHLTEIKVNSTAQVNTLTPQSLITPFGTQIGGDIFSLAFSDDNDIVEGNPGFNGSRDDPVLAYQAEFTSPVAAITGLRVVAVSTADVGPIRRRVDLWNWLAQTWINLSTDDITTPNEWTTTNEAYAGLLPLSTFLNPNRRIRVRVSYFDNTYTLPRGWVGKLDQLNVVIVR